MKIYIKLWTLVIMTAFTGLSAISTEETATQYVSYSSSPSRKIAVICGQRQHRLAVCAKMITRQLDSLISVNCLSQESIQKSILQYPSNLMKNKTSDKRYFTSGYLSEAEIQTILEYSKSLDTDYVLFIWMDGLKRYYKHPGEGWTTYNGKTFNNYDPVENYSGYRYEATLYCRLIDVNSKKVVGFHNMRKNVMLRKNTLDPGYYDDGGSLFNYETITYRHPFDAEVYALDSLLNILAQSVKEEYKNINDDAY